MDDCHANGDFARLPPKAGIAAHIQNVRLVLSVLGAVGLGRVPGFSTGAAALALTMFLMGAVMAGRLHTAIAHHRYR